MNMICNDLRTNHFADNRYKVGYLCTVNALMSVESQKDLLLRAGVPAENILTDQDCEMLDAAKACGAHSGSLFVVPHERILGGQWGRIFGALDRVGADLLAAEGEQLYSCVNGRTFESFQVQVDRARMEAVRSAPKKRKGGPQQKLTDRQLGNARKLWEESLLSAAEIAKKYKVAPNYFYRKFGPRRVEEGA